MPLRFTLHLGRFEFARQGRRSSPTTSDAWRPAAEEAGFDGHLGDGPRRADPQRGPRVGGHAREHHRARLPRRRHRAPALGALVNGITYRNLAQLGKQVATLDVLSGGRAFCGLGLAWHEREHALYGWDFPPVAERYAAARGRPRAVPAPVGSGRAARSRAAPSPCPRPSATRARSRSASRSSSADRASGAPSGWSPATPTACNLFGDPDVDRPQGRGAASRTARPRAAIPAHITVTQLSEAGVMAPGGERYADVVGTVEEQVGRYRALADAGVQRGVRRPPRGRHRRADRALRPRDRGLRSLTDYFREAVVLAGRRSSWRR